MIGISIYKCNTYIYLEVREMTLYYCMSQDTSIRAIYQLVKRDGKWDISEIVEADNNELVKEAVGLFSTEMAALDWMIKAFKTIHRIE